MDFSKMSDEELERIASGKPPQSDSSLDFSAMSDEELEKIAAGPPKERSTMESVLRGVDSVTGAPTRAAIGAIQDGKNPLSAFAENFAGDPDKAPTGKDIAIKAGAKDQTRLARTAEDQMKFDRLHNPGVYDLKMKSGGYQDQYANPAEAAGTFIDIGADWSNLVGTGLYKKGGQLALKGATSIPKVGGSIAKGAKAVANAPGVAKVAAGNKLKTLAETQAFRQSGAMLKDFRNTDISKAGRYILDDLGLKSFDTAEDIAGKARAARGVAGSKLDKIYTEAGDKFGDLVNKVGFDPVKHKQDILAAAKAELGEAEGAEAALKKVSDYLDEVAARHQEKIRNVGPVRPEDLDVPLSPRATNDVKSAIDDSINYARNPLTREPTKETAFKAARRAVSEKVDESIDALGGDEMLEQLKAANKDYGNAATIDRVAGDRVKRELANKQMFGLTDTITGAASLGYGYSTDDWGTAGAIFLGKKGLDKYGAAAVAKTADRISKQLLKAPGAAAKAKANPSQFKAVVLNMTRQALEGGEKAGAAAAQSPQPAPPDSDPNLQEKVESPQKQDDRAPAGTPTPSPTPSSQQDPPKRGPDKWAADGFDKVARLAPGLDRQRLLKDPQKRELLMRASSLDPNSKAMSRLVAELRRAK